MPNSLMPNGATQARAAPAVGRADPDQALAAGTEPAIQVRGLRKSYGTLEAVAGIDLTIAQGEIFALLGPNGAGKTTVVEILEGYRARNGGQVDVLGVDPQRATRDWRARIGVVLQTSRMEPELKVWETLALFAGYYPDALSVDLALELVGLSRERDRRVGRLSGGQQRRLDVGLALVGNPELLFLDEPTTGFDPAARRQFWQVTRGLRDLGKTVLLTTHYMDEARNLADRVAILTRGRVVACGRPGELGEQVRPLTHIAFALPPGVALEELEATLARACTPPPSVLLEIGRAHV